MLKIHEEERTAYRRIMKLTGPIILQNLLRKDVFIVILKEQRQSSCGEKLLDAFSLYLNSQERSRV